MEEQLLKTKFGAVDEPPKKIIESRLFLSDFFLVL